MRCEVIWAMMSEKSEKSERALFECSYLLNAEDEHSSNELQQTMCRESDAVSKCGFDDLSSIHSICGALVCADTKSEIGSE